MRYVHQRPVSVSLIVVMGLWLPLCCCLTSHADAAHGLGDGDCVQEVAESSCSGHGRNAPAKEGERRPAAPCECQQSSAALFAKSPNPGLQPGQERDKPGLEPLLLNRVATALLDTQPVPRPRLAQLDGPQPAAAAHSLFGLHALLLI